MNCDECMYYSWYYDRCKKWDCEVDAREVHNCFSERQTPIRDTMVNPKGHNYMGYILKHFQTICKHKAIVYRECKACGIWWQGVTHDLSKFSPTEFLSSAKHFQGNRSPIEAEKEKIGYSIAWLHHKGHNKHHWEWWVDYADDGSIIANKIPSKYVIEMVCDWVGAGIVYSKDKWTQTEPINYFYKVRTGRYFHPDTERLIVKLLEIIRDDGLERFHQICRARYPLFTDYEGLYIS